MNTRDTLRQPDIINPSRLRRAWEAFVERTLLPVGEWGMRRYLALTPLTTVEHYAAIALIPALFGLAVYLNTLP